MSSSNQQVGAYATRENRDKEDVRETEKRALISCANRLKAAIEDGGKDMKAYADAIQHNQKLWTLFQVALCDPDNQLPRHLKMILLNLSNYIDRVSFRAITEFSAPLLTSLMDINLTIAVGLNKKPPSETQQVQQNVVPSQVPTSPGAPTSVMTSA